MPPANMAMQPRCSIYKNHLRNSERQAQLSNKKGDKKNEEKIYLGQDKKESYQFFFILFHAFLGIRELQTSPGGFAVQEQPILALHFMEVHH